MPTPRSPQKHSRNLTCAIVTKSPVRPTSNGSMFTMNLCDQDPSSTIRAVCFDENLFGNFEANGTYDFKQFKVKKAYSSSNNIEVLIDQFTVAEKPLSRLTLKIVVSLYPKS